MGLVREPRIRASRGIARGPLHEPRADPGVRARHQLSSPDASESAELHRRHLGTVRQRARPLHPRLQCTSDPAGSGATSLFEQAPSWGAYAESMRRPCVHWFHRTRTPRATIPPCTIDALTDCPRARPQPPRARTRPRSADTLPAYVSVTPNMCHSMHNCSVTSGDAWLRRLLRAPHGEPGVPARHDGDLRHLRRERRPQRRSQRAHVRREPVDRAGNPRGSPLQPLLPPPDDRRHARNTALSRASEPSTEHAGSFNL